jgi:glycogen debranching enzyme
VVHGSLRAGRAHRGVPDHDVRSRAGEDRSKGANPHFEYRLPEVFAGYPRDEAPEPVELPRACSPQAWAAGKLPLLVRAMLGVEPDPDSRRLIADPVLPENVEG